jgi:hypothetical protein
VASGNWLSWTSKSVALSEPHVTDSTLTKSLSGRAAREWTFAKFPSWVEEDWWRHLQSLFSSFLSLVAKADAQ